MNFLEIESGNSSLYGAAGGDVHESRSLNRSVDGGEFTASGVAVFFYKFNHGFLQIGIYRCILSRLGDNVNRFDKKDGHIRPSSEFI